MKGELHCDSQSAIQVRYHFIRSALEDGVLVLEKILGGLNPADMLTKIVLVEKLKLCTTLARLLLEA